MGVIQWSVKFFVNEYFFFKEKVYPQIGLIKLFTGIFFSSHYLFNELCYLLK